MRARRPSGGAARKSPVENLIQAHWPEICPYPSTLPLAFRRSGGPIFRSPQMLPVAD